MMFSKRTSWELGESDFAAAVRARRDCAGLIDLTVSNPTACGFLYESDVLLGPLAQPAALAYEPVPFGMVRAREAVAAYYAGHGAKVSAARVCLTTSTSEAYSFLFRLLCDPGDEVLAATPSYPLFEFVAQLDSVRLRQYPLFHDPTASLHVAVQGWSVDLHALEQAITPATKAVLLVHPNNPTGHYVSGAERVALAELCARHGLALIVDEVFLDYLVEGMEAVTFAGAELPCLTFVLSGLSKVCGLPQMKCSWIAAAGPGPLVEEALSRLEVIADTYLSMNAPVQHALPDWLASRHGLQQQIRERALVNLTELDARLQGTQAQRLKVEGGWTVVLRVPRDVGEMPFVYAALERGVLVQPGGFYGLGEGRVVLSLLTPPAAWTQGIALLPVD